MTDEQVFVDYYDILQVAPNCDARILEAAYRYLAKLYHPDHMETADATKFNEVMEAYRTLRHPEQRAAYDQMFSSNRKSEPSQPTPSNENSAAFDESTALKDADAHQEILMFLYRKRRENAQNASIAGFYIQEMLNCSDESFDFHVWYLKAKDFIVVTEQGTLAITIQGVDHVISQSRTSMTEKLLLAQAGNS